MENNNTSTYGVIQEQGDMGLGFNPVYGKDQEIVKESCEKETVTKPETKF